MILKPFSTARMPGRQPPQLSVLFFTEMWERYGFYTMRGVLVLYMTQVFLFSDSRAYAVFATFAALLYLTPQFGGWIADNVLGFRRAVKLGGGLLATGYALLSLPGHGIVFHLALATIIVGNGFFKPNVSAMVGQLYAADDPRRQGGFTIFYAGINLGSLIPPLVTGWVILQLGWHVTFLIAAAGVLVGVASFSVRLRHFPELGAPPASGRRAWKVLLVALGTVLCLGLVALLTRRPELANVLLMALGGSMLVYSFGRSLAFQGLQRRRLVVVHVLIIFSIAFWALYQQAAMSLTVFTELNVNRMLGHWEVPTVMFQSVNPFLILVLAGPLSRLWQYLERRERALSTPAKFGFGTILMGLGFVLLSFAVGFQDAAGLIGPWWVVASYLLQSIAELFIAPVGLSMVTELTPKRMVGLMMGLWFFAMALANALAGVISDWTALSSGSNIPIATDPSFARAFGGVGWVAVAIGLLFLAFAPLLRRLIDQPAGGRP